MERNRQKPVGRDKGSLTEQQTEGTGITMVQIRRKHNTNRTTHRTALPDWTSARAPEPRVSSCPQLPPTGTQHDAHGMEYPALFGQVGFNPLPAPPAVPLPGFR